LTAVFGEVFKYTVCCHRNSLRPTTIRHTNYL